MSTGKFPEGWVSPQLDEIATDINYGYTASSTSENIGPKMLRITDIQDNKVDWNSVPFCKIEDNQKDKYLLCNGDLVFARTGATVGKSFLINEDISNTVFASYLIRVRCNKKISSHYLSYFFRSPTYWSQITEFSAGIGQPNVNGSKLKKLNLPLASVYEQKIIAEKLDKLLAQVDSTKARLEQIPQILKRFRQAVMKLAITGELTSEYRNNFPTNLVQEIAGIVEKERIEKKIKNSKLSKEPYPAKIPFLIPKSWQWYRLGHISLKITDGAHNTPKVLSEGYPYIMAKDLTKGKLDFSEERFISEKDHKELYFKCAPEVGDLLVVNIGAGTGNNVLIDSDIEFSFKNIAIIKKSKLITPTYLKIFFDSQRNRIFNEQTKGGAQPFLSLSVLNDIPFALPPLPEQHEIVRRVEQLFAYADTIEKQVNNALTRVNSLTQSILAKAFRGELTAQWRADNPSLISGENSAAALLERIKAERAASSGKKNSRKKA